jgi:hypothetical protein
MESLEHSPEVVSFTLRPYSELLEDLRKTVALQYDENPSIVYLDSKKKEVIADNGIDFDVVVLDLLSRKPSGP